MDENIYKKLFFVLIIILISVIIFNIIQQKPICLLHSCQDKQEEKKIVINIEPKNEPKFVPRLVLDPRIAFDDQTLRDPLLPPRTRDDWNVPLPAISTRGYPSPYHKLGMLINSTADNSDKFKFLLLGILADIGFLAFFKYSNFFIDNVQRFSSLFHFRIATLSL